MKLLLDEMWSAEVAVQLRRRGHDVAAVAERSDLRGQTDSTVFGVAQAEGRAVVTENAIDFRPLALDAIQHGRVHAGLILTSNRRFPRHDRRTIGRLIGALDELLASGMDGEDLEYWLS